MGNFFPAKLRKARETLGLTQEAFAQSVGLSAEFISLLESGKRTPSLKALAKIAGGLHRDMAYFFEERDPAFTILFRAASLDESAREALRPFQEYCEEYLHLEEAAGRTLEPAPLYENISPERLAAEERRRTGLGDEPIRDIFAFCERNGLRILRRALPPETEISGVFVYLEARNAAFALINAAHPLCRQAFSAAHEYCHYLKDRRDPPVIDTPEMFSRERPDLRSPREQYAQEFAAAFLMPPAKVREIAEKDFGGRPLAYEEVLWMKRYFGVSAQAMLRTLRDIGIIGAGKFEDYLARDHAAYEQELFGATGEVWGGLKAEGGIAEPSDPPVQITRNCSIAAHVSEKYRLLAFSAGKGAGAVDNATQSIANSAGAPNSSAEAGEE